MGDSTYLLYSFGLFEIIKVIIKKEIIKIISLSHLYSEIKIIINNVDKFRRKNAALSPERKIKTSIAMNKIETKNISSLLLLFLRTNNAKNKGNSLDK